MSRDKIPPVWRKSVPPGFWHQAEHRRAFVQWLGRKLRIRSPEKWYRLTRADVTRFGGSGLLKNYYGSRLPAMVIDCLPEYDLKEWLFSRTSPGFWDDPANRRRYLEWLGEKLGFREPEDWYRLRREHLTRNRGRSLLSRFPSIYRVVTSHFPEHEWLEWRFTAVARNFWLAAANRRRYLEWLGKKLGYEKHEDWYQLGGSDLTENHGSGLYAHYGGVAQLVMENFPEYEWEEWRFRYRPQGFWDDSANVRRYLHWLGEELGFKEYEDWYRVERRDFKANGGTPLLDQHGRSLASILKLGFPEYEWQEWWFCNRPQDYWDEPANVRRYLEWLGRSLGLERFEDWYRLRFEDLRMNGGHGLAEKFDSVMAVMTCGFPEYPWEGWRFPRPKRELWHDPAECRSYLKWLGEQLGYKTIEDWYQVTRRDFTAHRGTAVMDEYRSSPVAVLKAAMPEYDWKEWLFAHVPKGFWLDRANRRRYLEWLGAELGLKKPEQWWRFNAQDFAENHGRTVLELYDYAMDELFLDTFPRNHPAAKGIRAHRAEVRQRQRQRRRRDR